MYQGRFDDGEGVTGGSAAEESLLHEYQAMAHNYCFDTWFDGAFPSTNGIDITGNAGYPSGTSPTSFTTGAPTGPGATGTTSTIDWTNFDALNGPALKPGALFPDGTSMRVFDVGNGGNQAWGFDEFWGNYAFTSGNQPPAGLLQLWENFTQQASMHFTYNQAHEGWGPVELIAYNFDETYNSPLYDTSNIYKIVSAYQQATNQGNTALSATWAPSTNPVRTFLTDTPACWPTQDEGGDTGQGDDAYPTAVCADHINLSYPTSSFPNAWVTAWSPNAGFYMPGGATGLTYDSTANPASLTAGTGYQYTLDPAQGLPAQSTAPITIEKWFYQASEPWIPQDVPGTSGVGLRANFWIAFKYGLDLTTPSVGDPSPAAPDPGGVWDWADNFWGGQGEPDPGPGDCTWSPYSIQTQPGGGTMFYPGNELTCYTASGMIGANIFSHSLAVNGSYGITGPVASIRMEQWRRGYEDYEYLYLLGKQNGRAAAMTVVNSMGSDGLTPWGALNQENMFPYWDITGANGATGCTSTSQPNGPTGAWACPGEWTNDPEQYAAARATLAADLGFSSTTPIVSGVTPAAGPLAGGTSVTISGVNLNGATAVDFGGNAATSFTVNSSAQITATSPAGSAGTVNITVTTPNGTSSTNNNDQFLYETAPTLTGISPSSGPDAGGASVTLTGTNLTGATSVMFGSTAATSFIVNSSTSITATSPAESPGAISVTVITPGGASNAETFTFNAALTAQTISFANPGTQTVGTPLTLTATASSGLTVNLASTTASVCTVSGTTATFIAAGTCSITASQTGNSTYAAATPVLQSFTVNATVAPSFTIGGTAVTVTPGATTANTSTITVTPAGGFTGSVALTAAVTSSPTSAQDLPTLSFGSTTPVVISGANPGTATLTINTTGVTSRAVNDPDRPGPERHGVPWYAAGGATLACLLIFGIPARRRSWRTMLGMLVLLAVLASGAVACGGSIRGGGSGNSGTTAGSYTITVTGTSSSTTATGTVTLTVQ